MAGRPRLHPRGSPRPHRGWQHAAPGLLGAPLLLSPPRQLLDVEAHGDGDLVVIGLWLSFLRLAGASPHQAGAAGDATWALHRRRRPRHQRGRPPLSFFLPPRQAEDRAVFAPREGARDHGRRRRDRPQLG
ncbi:hypothetical protein VPH35_109124 [Triticum aestivum]